MCACRSIPAIRERLGDVRANFTATLSPQPTECGREVCTHISKPFANGRDRSTCAHSNSTISHANVNLTHATEALPAYIAKRLASIPNKVRPLPRQLAPRLGTTPAVKTRTPPNPLPYPNPITHLLQYRREARYKGKALVGSISSDDAPLNAMKQQRRVGAQSMLA